MEVKKFIAILKQHYKVVSDEDLAKVLYMTQPAITHWKRRGIPKKVLKRYGEIIEQFEGKGETINVKNQDIPVFKEGRKVEVGADYIIELQKDKIETQKKEIERLEEENKDLKDNPIQREKFESLDYDWKTTVDLKWGLKVQRRIYNLENISLMAKELGVTEKNIRQYFDTKNYYPMKVHPINKIITIQSLKELQNTTGWFMDLVRKGRELKTLLQGMGYLTLVIDYSLGEKTIKTLTHSFVVQNIPTIKIINKVQLIKE